VVRLGTVFENKTRVKIWAWNKLVSMKFLFIRLSNHITVIPRKFSLDKKLPLARQCPSYGQGNNLKVCLRSQS